MCTSEPFVCSKCKNLNKNWNENCPHATVSSKGHVNIPTGKENNLQCAETGPQRKIIEAVDYVEIFENNSEVHIVHDKKGNHAKCTTIKPSLKTHKKGIVPELEISTGGIVFP